MRALWGTIRFVILLVACLFLLTVMATAQASSGNFVAPPTANPSRQQGRYQSIDVPSALFTVALGINNSGLIVGRYVDSSINEHGLNARPKHDEQ
jgi:hypothetical protein